MNSDSSPRAEKNKNLGLLMIVGYPRSGTTLISENLSRHKDIAISPETHFFSYYFSDYHILSLRRRYQRFLLSHHLNDLSISKDNLVRLFSDLSSLNKRKLFLNLLDQHIKSNEEQKPYQKLYIGEKSPDHLLSIREIIRLFPNVKIINMVRDPRDVYLSISKLKWSPHQVTVFSLRWKYFIRKAMQYQREYPNNVLTVKFEKYISNNTKVHERVCKWLDLDIKRFSKCGKTTAFTFNSLREPWKGNAVLSINGANFNKWKDELSIINIGIIQSICAFEIKFFNYDKLIVKNKFSVMSLKMCKDIFSYFSSRMIPFTNKIFGKLGSLD